MYSDVVTCPEEKQGRNPGDGKNSFPKSDELLKVHTCQCFYESTVSPHMFRQECILLFPWHFGKSSSTSLIVTESSCSRGSWEKTGIHCPRGQDGTLHGGRLCSPQPWLHLSAALSSMRILEKVMEPFCFSIFLTILGRIKWKLLVPSKWWLQMASLRYLIL